MGFEWFGLETRAGWLPLSALAADTPDPAEGCVFLRTQSKCKLLRHLLDILGKITLSILEGDCARCGMVIVSTQLRGFVCTGWGFLTFGVDSKHLDKRQLPVSEPLPVGFAWVPKEARIVLCWHFFLNSSFVDGGFPAFVSMFTTRTYVILTMVLLRLYKATYTHTYKYLCAEDWVSFSAALVTCLSIYDRDGVPLREAIHAVLLDGSKGAEKAVGTVLLRVPIGRDLRHVQMNCKKLPPKTHGADVAATWQLRHVCVDMSEESKELLHTQVSQDAATRYISA